MACFLWKDEGADARITFGVIGEEGKMLQVDLLQYKIVRLDMVDMVEEGGEVRLISGTESEGQFEEEEDLAMVNLTEYVEMDGGYDKFHIEFELEGFFHIEGMKTREIRKEAHAMCYDRMRAYAVQVIKHLAAETGMIGFVPPERHMETDFIEFGGKPEERKEKAMKFQMEKFKKGKIIEIDK